MSNDPGISPVEQAIRRAMREGLFDNLPGTGKPLSFLQSNDEANTPEDQRMAYKIMKEQDVAPEWMMLGNALTQQQEKLRSELARGFRAYRGALHDADKTGDLGRRSRANRTWERLLTTFREAIAQYNQGITIYNLKVPHGVPKRDYFDLERELARLQP